MNKKKLGSLTLFSMQLYQQQRKYQTKQQLTYQLDYYELQIPNRMLDFSQTKINFLSQTSRKFYKRKQPAIQNSSFINNNQSIQSLLNPKPKLTKVIKILNNINTHNSSLKKLKSERLYERFHTEGQNQKQASGYFRSYMQSKNQINQNSKCKPQIKFNQQQFIRKQLKTSLQMVLKKIGKQKKKLWKQLTQSYEDVKYRDNAEVFLKKDNVFYTKLVSVLKSYTFGEYEQFQNDNNLIENYQKTQTGIQQKKFQKKQACTNQLKQNQKDKLKVKNQSQLQFQNVKLLRQNQLLIKQLLSLKDSKMKTNKIYRPNLNSQNRCMSGQNIKNNNLKQIVSPYNENLNKKQPTQGNRNSIEAGSLIDSLKLQINELSGKLQQLQGENIKLKDFIFVANQSLKTLKSEKNQMQNRIIELKLQNQTLCSEIIQIRIQNQVSGNKLQKWRATLAFQCQEINSFQNQLINVKNQYKNLNRKYKTLMKRINKINNTSTSQKLPELPLHYFEMFNEQAESFLKVKSILVSKNSNASLDKGVSQKGNIVIYKNFSNQKETCNNVSGIKRLPRQHYGYFKPSFYNLIQSYLDLHGIDQNNYEIIGSQASIDFLATIRAIFDSKFNQFLSDQFYNISSFPNFVYSWLNSFKIHQKTKKIVQLKVGQGVNLTANFYINLMRERLNANWQIITFREFIMNTLTKDQLYFYLLVRHAALKGDMIQNISGVYQQITYMNIADALILMQKFISDIGYRKRLQQYVKKSIIYVRKKALIDLHFICRIILEFYIFKKQQDFVNLNSLVELLARQKSGYLNFDVFIKIFDYNFTYLAWADKLNIYQKCFSSSRQKITLQVLLTVLSEQGYLCYEVKQQFLNQNIKLSKIQTKLDQQQFTIEPNLPELVKFQQYFRKKFNIFQKQTCTLGLQKKKKQLYNSKQCNQKTIFSRLSYLSQLCLLTAKKMFYSKKISIEQIVKVFPIFIDHFNRLISQTIQKKQYIQYGNQFKRNAAAKKIMRFYRKKKMQMHRNFIFNITDKITQEDEKAENIRQQFTNMISNLKNKFQSDSLQRIKLKNDQ